LPAPVGPTSITALAVLGAVSCESPVWVVRAGRVSCWLVARRRAAAAAIAAGVDAGGGGGGGGAELLDQLAQRGELAAQLGGAAALAGGADQGAQRPQLAAQRRHQLLEVLLGAMRRGSDRLRAAGRRADQRGGRGGLGVVGVDRGRDLDRGAEQAAADLAGRDDHRLIAELRLHLGDRVAHRGAFELHDPHADSCAEMTPRVTNGTPGSTSR
jgi:hypothetical protein